MKHWHFAGREGSTLEYQNLLAEKGATAVSSGMARIMFIQQDANVKAEEFVERVERLKRDKRNKKRTTTSEP